ncbi:MAG: transketolase family protein [Lachnospiraceae bacterium]|jgi:transketolase|nr:transketolase family protein [Lachnospiraceae bacterium]MCI8995986.1 transketolase family protein [Lachnospiraceae bacterium]
MKASFNFDAIFASGRDNTGRKLEELASRFDNVWVLTADTGGFLGQYKKDYGDRFVDVGIAEQNVMGTAAGLALAGNVCFVTGMIPFMTMRACEQVRTAICYQNLPVRLIGTGGGLTSGGGSTHNAMEDVALMRSLVNMTVISVADPNMIPDLLEESMTYPGPMYIRLAQGKKDRVIYEPGTAKYQIGKGLIVREGADVTIFAHGEMVGEAMDAALELEKEGIQALVADLYSIKPLDEELIMSCTRKTGKVIVLEDHLMYGGLASAVADVYADRQEMPVKFRRMGIPQVYAGFGSGAELQHKYGYDAEAVAAAVREMVNS